MSRTFWYTMDKQGVIELMKGEGVKSALMAEAEKLASAANDIQDANMGEKSDRGYRADVNVLDRTAVGVVHVGSIPSLIDQRKSQTLDALNH